MGSGLLTVLGLTEEDENGLGWVFGLGGEVVSVEVGR